MVKLALLIINSNDNIIIISVLSDKALHKLILIQLSFRVIKYTSAKRIREGSFCDEIMKKGEFGSAETTAKLSTSLLEI